MARNHAAVLAMLALGTNANAGVLHSFEAWQAASDAQSKRFFTGFGAFQTANDGLPDRHAEIVAGLNAALDHTNALYRETAANLTRYYPTEWLAWKPKLIQLTSDPDADVRQSALWAMGATHPQDDEVMRLNESTLRDASNPPRLRAFAAAGLGLAREKAKDQLPLLHEISEDKTANSFLRSEINTAVHSIERAINQSKTNSSK
jgi:hypothetical protein